MKKSLAFIKLQGIVSLFIFLFAISTVKAQDTTRTLFHIGRINTVGIYFAPEAQLGQLKGDFTSFTGGSLMLLLNKQWGIGVTGYMSADRSFSPASVSPLFLQSQFGGLRLEYTTNPNAAVHFSFPLVVGMGTARLDSVSNNNLGNFGKGNGRGAEGKFNNEFVVIQPGVQVEANLFRFVKAFAGANYRIAFSPNSTNTIAPNTLQGLSFDIGAKIGIFDIKMHRKHRS
jgi:hypothetical protein